MMTLDEARKRCDDTYIGPGPYFDYRYLVARHEYHLALFAAGMISRDQIEPHPAKSEVSNQVGELK